jgi:hypothetical protein
LQSIPAFGSLKQLLEERSDHIDEVVPTVFAISEIEIQYWGVPEFNALVLIQQTLGSACDALVSVPQTLLHNERCENRLACVRSVNGSHGF